MEDVMRIKIEGEAMLDPGSGRWYGVVRIIKDDGTAEEFKTRPLFDSRSELEIALVKRIRELADLAN